MTSAILVRNNPMTRATLFEKQSYDQSNPKSCYVATALQICELLHSPSCPLQWSLHLHLSHLLLLLLLLLAPHGQMQSHHPPCRPECFSRQQLSPSKVLAWALLWEQHLHLHLSCPYLHLSCHPFSSCPSHLFLWWLQALFDNCLGLCFCCSFCLALGLSLGFCFHGALWCITFSFLLWPQLVPLLQHPLFLLECL